VTLNGQPAFPVSTATTSVAGTQGLDPAQMNAEQLINQVLDSWGLSALSGTALGYIKQGYDSTAISFLLQSTPEYQARFPANADRIKAGLPPLSPAEYMSVEQSYRQVMSAAGLPKGFYDNQQSLDKFIANDMSPAELQQRVSEASTLVNQTDPTQRAALQQYYGVTPGMITAHFLDQNTAAPILQKQEQAAQIGGAALAQGLALTNQQKAEGYVDQGVTQAQAQNAYQKVASVLPGESQIAARYGQTYNQGTAEDEFLGGLASAQRARLQVNEQEKAQFSGGTGMVNPLYGNQGRAAGMGGVTDGSF